MRLPRYKRYLHLGSDKVFSYGDHVATIRGHILLYHAPQEDYSFKHVNYVAKYYGLDLVKEKIHKVNRFGETWLDSPWVLSQVQ